MFSKSNISIYSEMMNGSSSELEAMKQEILKEMRKEISKAKQEIIEGKN